MFVKIYILSFNSYDPDYFGLDFADLHIKSCYSSLNDKKTYVIWTYETIGGV